MDEIITRAPYRGITPLTILCMCGLQHVLYLKRVIIKNILSFKHADLPFDTYTVIVGPNNSGKTNLLRILDMISKNENLEYLQLDKEQKLDPDAPSEITLSSGHFNPIT